MPGEKATAWKLLSQFNHKFPLMDKQTLQKTFHFLANAHVFTGLEHLQAFTADNMPESRELYAMAESLQATALKFYELITD